jgi:hypothetical protein
MVTGQVFALGRPTPIMVMVHVAEHTITIDLADGDHRTFRRAMGCTNDLGQVLLISRG